MKGFVKQVMSLIISDLPLQVEYITEQFVSTHQKCKVQIPEWSTEATKLKLISQYWFSYVPAHFSLLFGLSSPLIFPLHAITQSNFHFLSILIAGIFCYPILYLFYYRPAFGTVFLPRLITVKEVYEFKQRDQMGKCRHGQLSNFSLTLFFYVFATTNRLNSLKCDESAANLLMRLYGVDPGSLKKNLELILGTSKRNNLSERKITELRNRFDETYTFLEDLGYMRGTEKLKELELKFFGDIS